MSDVRLLTAAFDAGEEMRAFTAAQPQAGGIVSFLDQVGIEDGPGGGCEARGLRHYDLLTLPGMWDPPGGVRERCS